MSKKKLGYRGNVNSKNKSRDKAEVLSETLEFLEEVSVPSTALTDIMQLVTALEKAEEEVTVLEEQLVTAKEERDRLSKSVIPEMLLQHGLEELKLANGKHVTIKDDLYVRLPKDLFKKERSFSWMIEHGAEALIKEVLTVDEPKIALIEVLNEQGVAYTHSKDVNTNSLKAFFREGLGLKKNSIATFSKEDVPTEFGLFLTKETIVK